MYKINNNLIFRSAFICMIAGVFAIMCMSKGSAQTSQLFRVNKKEVSGKIPESSDAIAAGKKIYEIKCYYCHGIKGDGNGSDAPRLDPKPRNFTRNEYKIRSTGQGVLPTDEDLFRIISSGVEGSAMPFWNTLTPEERWQVIYYIKTFNSEFKGNAERTAVSIGGGSASSPDSIKRGKKLFKEAKCILCHGEDGRGDGALTTTLKKQWDLPFKARDLTHSWMFKGGNAEEDIYRTVTTGLNETPMGSYADYLTDEDRWHLSHYVKSISHDMKTDVVLKSRLVDGNLPEGPEDVAWGTIEAVELPLAGQIVASPRFWTPSANSVRIKSFYNKENIAFLVEWDDRTNEQAETYSDAVAIQFPTKIPEAQKKPYFAMGDSSNGVELLHWKAFDESILTAQGADDIETETDGGEDLEEEEAGDEEAAAETEQEEAVVEEVAKEEFKGFYKIKEMNAKGFRRLSVQPDNSQNSLCKGHWKNGKWQVMITRPIFTADKK